MVSGKLQHNILIHNLAIVEYFLKVALLALFLRISYYVVIVAYMAR